MHALLLAALAAFAGPARAGSAGDQLCGATGNSAGCIGTVQPTSHYEPPERPDCDDACRQQARDDERYALSHIVEPGEVASLNPVSYREDRTVASYIKGDDNENKVLLACVLVIGAPAEAPLWLVGVFGAVVAAKVITSYPGSNLERYVSAIWESLPISLAWKPGTYVPAPKVPSAFPNLRRATPKTPVQGGGSLRKRWVDEDGNIYEWDYQHGRVEKYNKRGKHLGEYDPDTGEQTKPADPNKEVEP